MKERFLGQEFNFHLRIQNKNIIQKEYETGELAVFYLFNRRGFTSFDKFISLPVVNLSNTHNSGH